jgi:uroporphyrinogen-III synthase
MARRARVATVDGYGVELEMPPGAAAELGTVDRVGFANGTAARHLAEGLGRVGDGAAIPATARIVAVGAATAAIASSLGFAVSAVADGGLIGLADLLLSA